jgi:thiamine-phosphate pyrophosphorylase
MPKKPSGILRALDANINRAREGLRVCEDICRFCFNSPIYFKKIRVIRRSLDSLLRQLALSPSDLALNRDSVADPGKKVSGKKVSSAEYILLINLQRSKESLRVIEELSRLVSPRATAGLQELRFKLYNTEKQLLLYVASLRNH